MSNAGAWVSWEESGGIGKDLQLLGGHSFWQGVPVAGGGTGCGVVPGTRGGGECLCHPSCPPLSILHLAAAQVEQGQEGCGLAGAFARGGVPEVPGSAPGQGPCPGERALAPASLQLLTQLCFAFKYGLPTAQCEPAQAGAVERCRE